MTGIRQRVVSYELSAGPQFLKGLSITVTEGIVEIAVLKDEDVTYAYASIDAETFVADAKFLIEGCQE